MAKIDSSTAHEPSAKYQYLGAVIVNLLTMCHGVSCGWSSVCAILLTSDETPLESGKITMDEASWIASLLCVGGLPGNVFCGIVTNKYGRKKPLIFIAIPTIICWLIVLYAKNIYYLYAARILNGFVGSAIFVITPLYLSEISNDRVRGFLGSTLVLSANVGILIVFILGNYCDFFTTPKIVISVLILFMVLFSFCPESPSFLFKQNRITDAEKSIRFYQNMRGKDNDYELLQLEINKLKNAFDSVNSEKSNENSFSWSDVITDPGRKALIIGSILMALNQFSGCFAMLSYTASIFKEAGSSLPPNMSAIIVGVIQVIGSYVASFLVDRAGRKFLFAVSTIGTAIGLSSLGIYMMFKSWNYDVDAINWLPIMSFSFVIFIASWAILSLPFLILSEILPEKLKNFGMTFCINLLGICAFLVVKNLPLLTETLKFHGTMFLFAAVSLLGGLFIMLFMPETKGKSYEEIMEMLH